MGEAVDVTLLNSMAGSDFEPALDRHLEWGVRTLDLKDCIYGKPVADLSDAEAEAAAKAIERRKLSVYCLSTMLFAAEVELGEAAFRERYAAKVDRAVHVAKVLRPAFIRLVASFTNRRNEVSNAVDYVDAHHPWLLEMYREAIDKFAAAGFQTAIENETYGCILGSPEEALDLFKALRRTGKVAFTWDIVNMWQAGTFPTLEVYQRLKPIIGYCHYKGGRSEGASSALQWRSSLRTASWPVRQITERVVRDRVSPVICLNPAHGRKPLSGDDSGEYREDIQYLRGLVREVSSTPL